MNEAIPKIEANSLAIYKSKARTEIAQVVGKQFISCRLNNLPRVWNLISHFLF
jgi:hypothetical protein